MKGLAIGLAFAVLVFVVSGGQFFFLPLLFLPFGFFSFGQRRQKQRTTLLAPRRRSRWF